MKAIKISQWKGKRGNHFMIDYAARYYTRKLLGKRMADNISYHIRIRNNWPTAGLVLLDQGKSRQRDFEIRLLNMSDVEMLLALAHEIIHVYQRVRNKIVIQIHDTKEEVWYGDKTYFVKDGDDESELPWELEAYNESLGLFYSLIGYMEKCTGEELLEIF